MDASYVNLALNAVTILLTGGALGLVLRHRHAMKSLAENSAQDIRKHYAEELGRVVERQRKCEEREQELQKRVSELENDILGLIRIISQASADKVLTLGESVPEHIRAMAERVQRRIRS